MALNFPSSPTIGQVYTDSTSGFSYEWDGTVWKSFSPASSNQIKTLDDISSSFDGIQDTFALTSSGSAITPASAQSLIINLGGVIQDPTSDYSVSGSNIVFSTPPTNGLSFSGISLGPAVPVNTIPDGAVTGGSLRISTTAVVGSATTFSEDLVVEGDARVTGILTVGTSSITLNGTNNTINVGSGVTISSNDINVSGAVTASSFSGDGSNLTGISSVSFATTSFGLSGSPAILVSSAGINTTSSPTKLYVEGNAASNVVGLGTTDANTVLDFSQGNNFSLTLVGSIVLSNPTGVTTGQSGVIHISQDGIGNHTVGFGSHWDFVSSIPPTLSTTANALDTLTYAVRNSTSIVAAALVGVGTI